MTFTPCACCGCILTEEDTYWLVTVADAKITQYNVCSVNCAASMLTLEMANGQGASVHPSTLESRQEARERVEAMIAKGAAERERDRKRHAALDALLQGGCTNGH